MSTGYDAIADIYDVDMGASMTLPDVEYFVAIAKETGGSVLELGCGTGRVMTGLIAAGIDACGIDRSSQMLAQAKRRLGPVAPLIRMDIRRLGLSADFALALLPYSLVTYLTKDEEWERVTEGLYAALAPGAYVLLDAFIPQPIEQRFGWTRDYARRIDSRWLVRHKQIVSLGPRHNRIKRRYRMRGAFNGRTLSTVEDIVTYAPDDLSALARRHFGRIDRIDFDYRTCDSPSIARFCSVLARIR